MTKNNDMKIVLNLSEEPFLVYLDDELVMLEGGWRYDMLEPCHGGSWIELIQQYKTFSGVQEYFQFTEDANDKYRLVGNFHLIPKNFNDFKDDEIISWVEEEEEEDKEISIYRIEGIIEKLAFQEGYNYNSVGSWVCISDGVTIEEFSLKLKESKNDISLWADDIKRETLHQKLYDEFIHKINDKVNELALPDGIIFRIRKEG